MEGYRGLRLLYPDLPANLKEEQIQAVNFVCQRKHVLCVLPTGFGKSLLFTIPPLLLDKIALVISPLKALMASQVKALRNSGISAVAVTGGKEMTAEDRDCLKKGTARIIFISPEGLEVWMDDIHKELYQDKLCILAFDEVHTLAEWGERFRPAFRTLGRLRSLFEKVPVLMLTATMSEAARSSVFTTLHLNSEDVEEVFKYPDRPNISLRLQSKSGMDVLQEMQWYLDELTQSKKACPKCIMYVNGSLASLGKCYRDIRQHLQEKAFSENQLDRTKIMVELFHASLPSHDRERIINEFSRPDSQIRLLLATSAFGMGIDIKDIKYVVLWGAPSTASEVWQEVGRAGRDGNPSEARLLFTPQSMASANTQPFLKQLVKETPGTCIRKLLLRSVFYKMVDSSLQHDERCCTIIKK